MKKIIIIGCPGSGKSTLALTLHEKTQLPLTHLDMLFWNADRTTVSREIFLERLQAVMQKDCWILDGNYSTTMELRMSACDTVIFLDYPADVCLDGIRKRRGKVRPDLPWIETGDTPDYEEFLAYIRDFETNRRPQILTLLERFPEKHLLHFTNRAQAQYFLDNIELTGGVINGISG